MSPVLIRSSGDTAQATERLVVAAGVGTFRAVAGWRSGDRVDRGDVMGVLRRGREEHVVTTPFAGELAGLLAADGERVRDGQPLVWIRPR